ncbi:MAG: hypothetical protein OEM59_19180 [Rhodospirillales bacterium]|nr:hypothetical protein [Rhodospirillales bacterium]
MDLSARSVLTLLILAMATVCTNARADWINLTGAETSPNIAEITIGDEGVRVMLEVYVGDLETFHDLIPDDWIKDATVDRLALAERLRRFSSETFLFVTETGTKLQATLELAEPRLRKDRFSPFAGMINPITRQRVAEAPEDKRVLYAELFYPFERRPKELTIIPPLDEEGRAQVSIGFVAYHKEVPIIDFRYLSAPARVRLDWEDPWYTKFDNPNLKRHHKDALMSFLYLEPYEVRHEILTRVKDMEAWMDLGLRGDRYIEPDELEPLKQRIAEFLVIKNPVRVDGQSLRPILDRADYVKVGLKGIQLVGSQERLEISTAIVGVIFAYIINGLPQEVTVDWELFTDQIQKVPATAIDPAGPLLTYLVPDDNVHRWINFLKNYEPPNVRKVDVDRSLTTVSLPIGSLLCAAFLMPVAWQVTRRRRTRVSTRRPALMLAGALIVGGIVLYPTARISVSKPAVMTPDLDDAEAQAILHALLKNVYRASEFREEEDVYDKLAISLNGDLLVDVYVQNRRSFAVQKAGGAQAKVKEVEILSVEPNRLDGDALTYALRARWTAMGTVGHWGHVHVRKNLYDAVVRIEVADGAWKITGLELQDETRIDAAGASPSRKAAAAP